MWWGANLITDRSMSSSTRTKIASRITRHTTTTWKQSQTVSKRHLSLYSNLQSLKENSTDLTHQNVFPGVGSCTASVKKSCIKLWVSPGNVGARSLVWLHWFFLSIVFCPLWALFCPLSIVSVAMWEECNAKTFAGSSFSYVAIFCWWFEDVTLDWWIFFPISVPTSVASKQRNHKTCF